MASDVKWIKITTDIFDGEKIILIESLPDAYAIITVWFKLLCLAGKQNNSGVFLMGRIPYTDKMLATIFRMKESTVTMALQTFEQFGMVELVDGVITIPNWNKHQSLDAYEKKRERDRLYQAERRAAQKALAEKSSDKSSDIAVSDKEEDKEEDKEKEIDKELYISIISYLNEKAGTNYKPTTAKTKTAINGRLAEGFTLDDFKTVIDKKCDEWLNDENMSKYLRPETLFGTKFEGYLNQKTSGKRTEMIPKWMKKQPDYQPDNERIRKNSNRLKQLLGEEDYQPTPERIKKNNEWLDSFLAEQERQAELTARAEALKESLQGGNAK